MARQSHRIVITAFVAALSLFTLASCSGGSKKTEKNGSSTTVPGSQWDASAIATLRTLAQRVQQGVPGQCTDLGALPRDQYVLAADRLRLAPPLAVADCTISGGPSEFNVFKDAQTRDVYDHQRTQALCSIAKQGQVPILGLHFVVGENYSIQAANEGAGREIANVLHGTYTSVPCSGVTTLDWQSAGEAQVRELAAKLRARPNVKCDNYQLLDYDTYARNRSYVNRLPAAYAQCDSPSGPIHIAAFSGTSATPDAFLAGEVKAQCNGPKGVAVVRGDDWAVLVGDTKIGAIAQAALGGTLSTPTC